MDIILAGLIGLVLGVLLALVLRKTRGAETAALRTQVEERERQVRELKALIAERDASLLAAGEQRASLEARLARTGAELEATRRQADEKIEVLTDAREQLEESFKALAGETLKANSEAFIVLARSHLEALVNAEQGQLDRRRESIEKLMSPLGDSLKRYEEHLRSVEKTRDEAYAGLRQQVTSLMDAQTRLQRETTNLVNALRMPQTRGRWGELTLRRAVELAGMSPHCDFSEQVSVDTPEGRQRPDMIIHLPAERDIVVDSKVSLSAYLSALECGQDGEREKCLSQHASQVRAHMERLASKDYSKQFENAPEFVVLFLPGESFFSAAMERDPALIEDGMKRSVILATPTTLMALLRAIAHGWRQAGLEQNARRISDHARELYDRLGIVCRYLNELGRSLQGAMDSYNRTVGSLNSRLLPHARRIKELGVTASADLPDLDPVEGASRAPELPEEDGLT